MTPHFSCIEYARSHSVNTLLLDVNLERGQLCIICVNREVVLTLTLAQKNQPLWPHWPHKPVSSSCAHHLNKCMG